VPGCRALDPVGDGSVDLVVLRAVLVRVSGHALARLELWLAQMREGLHARRRVSDERLGPRIAAPQPGQRSQKRLADPGEQHRLSVACCPTMGRFFCPVAVCARRGHATVRYQENQRRLGPA
jgi:hypothetical protein